MIPAIADTPRSTIVVAGESGGGKTIAYLAPVISVLLDQQESQRMEEKLISQRRKNFRRTMQERQARREKQEAEVRAALPSLLEAAEARLGRSLTEAEKDDLEEELREEILDPEFRDGTWDDNPGIQQLDRLIWEMDHQEALVRSATDPFRAPTSARAPPRAEGEQWMMDDEPDPPYWLQWGYDLEKGVEEDASGRIVRGASQWAKAIVLVPTEELAIQVQNTAKDLLQGANLLCEAWTNPSNTPEAKAVFGVESPDAPSSQGHRSHGEADEFRRRSPNPPGRRRAINTPPQLGVEDVAVFEFDHDSGYEMKPSNLPASEKRVSSGLEGLFFSDSFLACWIPFSMFWSSLSHVRSSDSLLCSVLTLV